MSQTNLWKALFTMLFRICFYGLTTFNVFSAMFGLLASVFFLGNYSEVRYPNRLLLIYTPLYAIVTLLISGYSLGRRPRGDAGTGWWIFAVGSATLWVWVRQLADLEESRRIFH